MRKPAWLYGPAAALVLFAVSLIIAGWAASGFRLLDAVAMQGLAWPAAIGAGLAAGLVHTRARRGALLSYRAAALRCAAALAAAGFAWPLSFGLTGALGGDWRAFGDAFGFALAGGAIGALAGGIGGAAAGVIALRRR